MVSRAVSSWWSLWSVGLLVFSLLGSAACGGAQTAEAEAMINLPERERFDTLRRNTYRRVPADINADGVNDQYSYYSGERLRWRERDLDFDGTTDFFEYYDASGATVEQEFQLDFDPAIDLVRVYQDGVLYRKELSTTFDGAMSMFKIYDQSGQLIRIERDTTLDGDVDVWMYYSGGELVRTARDEDGDGLPDGFETVEDEG